VTPQRAGPRDFAKIIRYHIHHLGKSSEVIFVFLFPSSTSSSKLSYLQGDESVCFTITREPTYCQGQLVTYRTSSKSDMRNRLELCWGFISAVIEYTVKINIDSNYI
jgi:hypothetical protein